MSVPLVLYHILHLDDIYKLQNLSHAKTFWPSNWDHFRDAHMGYATMGKIYYQ